ncbi:hypothetical protein E3J79_01705 [Candidatus Dependentiae bacterium]|nr:MAG: hypothetical protein E3J79_01705 [Candidatus Dependentiae bacterium]
MQIKWNSIKLSVISLLFAHCFNLVAMDCSFQRVGKTPEHLKMVPTSSHDDWSWRFFGFAQGIYKGCRALVKPSDSNAVKKRQGDEEQQTRFDINAVPQVASEMILTEAIYHGCNAVCKTQSIDLDSSLSVVRAASSSCSRLAAYTIAQKCKQQCFPNSADPGYKKNVRAMLEDATASVIWASIKDTSRGVGLTKTIDDLLAVATHEAGFDKLPLWIQTLGKFGMYVTCGVVDYIGKALVKDTVVMPLSSNMFGSHHDHN